MWIDSPHLSLVCLPLSLRKEGGEGRQTDRERERERGGGGAGGSTVVLMPCQPIVERGRERERERESDRVVQFLIKRRGTLILLCVNWGPQLCFALAVLVFTFLCAVCQSVCQSITFLWSTSASSCGVKIAMLES